MIRVGRRPFGPKLKLKPFMYEVPQFTTGIRCHHHAPPTVRCYILLNRRAKSPQSIRSLVSCDESGSSCSVIKIFKG
jgi:hypothetical protein